MPTTPSIPSVRTRNQHLNACNRKSPPFLSNPTTAPNVGIHGTMRRGLHTANLQVQASRSLLCARSAELQDANPTTSTVEADGIIHNCHHVSEATHQSNTPFLSTSDRITEGSKLDGVITSTTYAHALPTFFDWRTGPRGVAFVNDSLSALYGLSDKSAGLLKVANNLLSEATVPGPPLLARSTGLSTRYNSHPRTAGDISHLSVGNVAATAAANPTADFELGSLFVESGGFPFGACFPDTMGGYSVLQQIKRKAGGLPVMTGETGNATLESLYGAPMPALSPVTEISTLLAQTSHGSIGKVISSDEYNVSVASPAAVLPAGSRVVQTPDGPAILLSSLHTMAHPVASTTYPRRFQHWTEEEDELLKAAAALEGGPPCNWTKISRKYFLGSRTDTQCKGRWKKALKPGISRAPWEAHEDQYVIQARESGEAWPAIASLLPGRIAEQIRERYINHLDPQLIRTPWTEQETFVLYEAQKRMGNKWCSISELLPGRSENSVKNRWHNAKMMQRRAMRRLITTKAREDHLERAKSHSVTSNMDGATPSRSPSSESEDEYSASV